MARRRLANAERGRRRQLRLVERVGRLDPPRELEESGEDHAEDHAEVHAALAGLRELDREVVRLWTWEGLAPREIAVVTGLTANAVSIRLHKAKRALADALAKQAPGENALGENPLGKDSRPVGQTPDEGRKP